MFDIYATHLREVVEQEQVEQPLQKRWEYVNEMVLLKRIWMVWRFGKVRGPWLEKAFSVGM